MHFSVIRDCYDCGDSVIMIVMIFTVMFITVYSGNSKFYLYQNDFLAGNWESQHSGNSSTVMTAYT